MFLYLIQTGIPTFSSHAEHRRHILIHTAATFRDFARKGFTEGMSGHISVRDPEFENYIWMNPLGKHFGLMTAGDLICLDVVTGKVVGGNRVFYSIFPLNEETCPDSSVEPTCQCSWILYTFRDPQSTTRCARSMSRTYECRQGLVCIW